MRHGHIGTEHCWSRWRRAGGRRARPGRASARGPRWSRPSGSATSDDRRARSRSPPPPRTRWRTRCDEAMRLGHGRSEPGHVLLAVLRQRDGVARRVLVAAGRDAERVPRGDRRGSPPAAGTARAAGAVVAGLGERRARRPRQRRDVDARLLLAILERDGPSPPGCASAASTRPPCGGCSSRAAGGAWRRAPRRRGPASGRRRRRARAACRRGRAGASSSWALVPAEQLEAGAVQDAAGVDHVVGRVEDAALVQAVGERGVGELVVGRAGDDAAAQLLDGRRR